MYHILATISAHHCTASTFESTDWQNILALYDMLKKIDPSPIVLLNRAVILSKTANVKKALEQLDEIKNIQIIQSYMPYYTTRAELHFMNKEPEKAAELLNNALKLSSKEKHIRLIYKKLKEYSEKK